MIDHKTTNSKEPSKFVEVDENLTVNTTKPGSTIEQSYFIIQHFIKCMILAVIIFILLEKISRKYHILNVETNKEEEAIEVPQKNEIEKENFTFFCDEPLSKNENVSLEALNNLREDIVNLKQLVIKLGEQVRERRRFECIAKKELSTIESKVKKVLLENGVLDENIKRALLTYEADKIALFDYAASYAGGHVLSIVDTVPAPTSKISQVLGFFNIVKESSPDQIVNPSCLPGECFTFLGDKAKFILKLGKSISIGSVSMEHSFSVDHTSAPREFMVYALKAPTIEDENKIFLGKFSFNIDGKRNLQTFEVHSGVKKSEKYEYVMLEILSNHGHEENTSIYRFRVHAK